MEIDILKEITKYFEQPQFAATKDISWRWQIDSLTVTRDAIISFARYFLNLGTKFTEDCKLEEIPTENLRAELKRRIAVNKELKAKEMAEALRCRNCKHCQKIVINWRHSGGFYCAARMWGNKTKRHYHVSLSQKACDKFERKEK